MFLPTSTTGRFLCLRADLQTPFIQHQEWKESNPKALSAGWWWRVLELHVVVFCFFPGLPIFSWICPCNSWKCHKCLKKERRERPRNSWRKQGHLPVWMNSTSICSCVCSHLAEVTALTDARTCLTSGGGKQMIYIITTITFKNSLKYWRKCTKEQVPSLTTSITCILSTWSLIWKRVSI